MNSLFCSIFLKPEKMSYYINLEEIPIETYGEKLKTAYLPPSRKILAENNNEIFSYFKSIGINNLLELIQLLKKKNSFIELQKVKCLSLDYLKILLRELNSILPKPNKLKDFKGPSEKTILELEKIGVTNTKKLYDLVLNENSRIKLSKQINVPYNEILHLTKLTDLSRIKWVGSTFASMLYELSIDSVEKASKTDPIKLHQQLNQLSKEQSIYKANIGLNDIKIFVEAANEVPVEIEF